MAFLFSINFFPFIYIYIYILPWQRAINIYIYILQAISYKELDSQAYTLRKLFQHQILATWLLVITSSHQRRGQINAVDICSHLNKLPYDVHCSFCTLRVLAGIHSSLYVLTYRMKQGLLDLMHRTIPQLVLLVNN